MKFLVTTLAASLSLMIASAANAQVIFDAIAGDAVETFSNATNAAPTLSVNAPTATLTRSDGALSHFVSVVDIQTLRGGGIAATDVVRITWVVDSITGYTTANNNNGIEFGLSTNTAFRGNTNPSTISRFRADSSLANANKVGHGFGNVFVNGPGQTENQETEEGGTLSEATAASFEDGFTVVQTISADGVTTQYSDIVVTNQNGTPSDETVLTTVISPFADDVDFVDFVNGAHFYAGAQIADTAGGVITFSRAQIELGPFSDDCILGDTDGSGAVDFDDISPFIQILSSGGNQCEADCDESGAVDFDDIAPFISILSGS